ncbi:MAG: hypothetical protein ABIG03_08210 [Candidatus Eisenbacteria bacterium]
MRRLRILVGVLLVLAVLAVTGCYTVLRHPTGTDVVQHDSYYRSCADCHADAQFYHPYYSYGRSHNRWNNYYGHPWWYDDYWWWDHHDGDGGDPVEIEKGDRHLWGSGGWASGGWGFTKPSGTSPPRTTPKPPSDAAVDDSKEPKPKDEKEPEKSDERNLWKGKKKKGF